MPAATSSGRTARTTGAMPGSMAARAISKPFTSAARRSSLPRRGGEAMSALFAGHTASLAALGAMLLVIPLIAVAAKLAYEQARKPSRDELPRHRAGDRRTRRRD